MVTVQPRFNKGPRDWQSLFVISRFFFIYFTIIAEMLTSGNLKSGDPLFFTIPTRQISTTPPAANWPSPQWEWLRTLYEVLHDVHTIKIHDHCFNAEIIYTSKNAPEPVLRKTKIHILRKKRGTYQTKAQKRSKDHFIQEIWWPIQESGRSVPYPGELARMLLG